MNQPAGGFISERELILKGLMPFILAKKEKINKKRRNDFNLF